MHAANYIQQKRLNSRSTVGGAPKVTHYKTRFANPGYASQGDVVNDIVSGEKDAQPLTLKERA